MFQIEDVDRCCLRGQCAAVIGFDIYLIGGIEYGRISNPFRCFNAVTKTWRDVAPMNHVRYDRMNRSKSLSNELRGA
jgi:kelch-like protein 10